MMGTVAGIALLAWTPSIPPPELFFAGIFALFCCCLLRWRAGSRLVLGILCGCGYGVWWSTTLPDPQLASGGRAEVRLVRGWVAEFPQLRSFSQGGQRQRFAFAADVGMNCRVLLSYYGDQPLQAGQRWQLEARLKPVWGLANPGSFNYQVWLIRNGFCATGYVREKSLLRLAEQHSPIPLHQLWRQSLHTRIQALPLSDLGRGLVLALTIGDRSQIPAASWEMIKQLGLGHLLVISGLHVGLVAGFGFAVGRLLGRLPGVNRVPLASHITPHLCALTAAALFSALAGFSLPAQRAMVMLAAVQTASLWQRRLSGQHSLVLALFVVSLIDPLCTHSPGFWLSFGAVAFIFYLLHVWRDVPRWRLLLQLQCLLAAGTGALASFWFGGVSLVAPVANLVAVPLVCFLVTPLCLAAALFLPAWPGLSAWLLQWVDGLAGLLEIIQGPDFPGREVFWYSLQPQLPGLMLALAGLLILLFAVRQPWAWLSLLLFFPLLRSNQAEQVLAGDMKLTVLDVGQGLAAVVRTAGHTLVYDTGSGDPAGPNMASSVILPYLRRFGVGRIDILVISHGDRDHASGVYTLAGSLAVGEIWYGDQPFRLSVPQRQCRRGGRSTSGELKIREYHPSGMLDLGSGNDRSCVLMLDHLGYRVLMPGDIGKSVERDLLYENPAGELSADLLLAPHHGSRTSSSALFVRKVAPAIAVVSAGFLNRFGHPHPDVQSRYLAVHSGLFNTATDGAVEVWVRGGELRSVRAYRQRRWRPHWQ